jgi:outer membrane protein assembly factor BamB
VDGDGVQEILFITNIPGTRLWCYDAYARLEWVYPSLEAETMRPVKSKVSLVDVDNDKVMELAVLDITGGLYVLRGDGSLAWSWTRSETGPGEVVGAPQAMDVDGDGFVEFFVPDRTGHLFRISHEGEPVWMSSVDAGPGDTMTPTICDLDQDGDFELVWATVRGDLFCLDAASGNPEWCYPTEAIPWPMVVDLNDDREYEVLVWTRLGYLVCLTFYGSELWRWPYGESFPMFQCAALGDVDRDGEFDLVYVLGKMGVCLDVSGPDAWPRWELNLTSLGGTGGLPDLVAGGGSVSYQSLADFDGDGELEILWLVPFPLVMDAVSGSLESFYVDDDIKLSKVDVGDGGWWGDADDDSRSEWICDVRVDVQWPPIDTQIYCLTMSGRFPAESPWPEYYHTAYPAEYQREQEWLTLKSAGSNSLWFPIQEAWALVSLVLLVLSLPRGSKSKSHP